LRKIEGQCHESREGHAECNLRRSAYYMRNRRISFPHIFFQKMASDHATSVNWDIITQHVVNKKYSLFNVEEKDQFDEAYLALSADQRSEIVKEIREALQQDSLRARDIMHTLVHNSPHVHKRRNRESTLRKWIFFLISLVILLKSGLSLGFGPLEWEGVFDALFTTLCVSSMFFYRDPADIYFWIAIFPTSLLHRSLEWIRLISIVPFLKGLGSISSGSLSRMMGLFLVMVLCTHSVACARYALGVRQDFSTEWGPPAHYKNQSKMLTYWQIFNWALKSLTQGPDGSPETFPEVFLSLFVMILGFSVYAVIVGAIGATLMNLNSENEKWIEKTEDVDRYAISTGIPQPLFKRITDYYAYLRNHRRGHSDTHEIFFELPVSLQTDISLHLTKDLLSQVSFFKDAPLPCLSFIAKQLKPLSFPPGERIVTEGEVGQSMYFLMKGNLRNKFFFSFFLS